MKQQEYRSAARHISNVTDWLDEIFEEHCHKSYKSSKNAKILASKILATWSADLKKNHTQYKTKEKAVKVSAFIKAVADLLE